MVPAHSEQRLRPLPSMDGQKDQKNTETLKNDVRFGSQNNPLYSEGNQVIKEEDEEEGECDEAKVTESSL